MKDNSKWMWIAFAVAVTAVCLCTAISESTSTSMSYHDRYAYEAYLEACKEMSVTPVPPQRFEEGKE